MMMQPMPQGKAPAPTLAPVPEEVERLAFRIVGLLQAARQILDHDGAQRVAGTGLRDVVEVLEETAQKLVDSITS